MYKIKFCKKYILLLSFRLRYSLEIIYIFIDNTDIFLYYHVIKNCYILINMSHKNHISHFL